MRQGPHNKRGRGRGGNTNRRSGTPNRNQTYDSNGPEVRIRGNANQVHEKYMNLARDAAQNGDRVLAESYFQHAEHYYRIISAFTEEAVTDQNRNRGNGSQQSYGDDSGGNQFQEGEPQPELDLAALNARPGQPAAPPAEAQAPPEAVVEIKSPHAPEPEGQSPEAGNDEAKPADTSSEPTREDAPTRRPLSLRRRRNGSDEAPDPRSSDKAEKAAPADEAAATGVTVTVVGAPVLDPSEAPPPRPRRRPRAAAAPTQPEETPGD
jgi:hypothetical protein